LKLKILKKITNNLQSFTEDELIYIKELISKDILKYTNNNFLLNKKYKVGTLTIQKDIFIAHMRNHTLIKIRDYDPVKTHTPTLKKPHYRNLTTIRIIYRKSA